MGIWLRSGPAFEGPAVDAGTTLVGTLMVAVAVLGIFFATMIAVRWLLGD